MKFCVAWLHALACLCAACGAAAQTYPTKPIRIIVPFPPAGASDLLTRTIGQKLGETWSRQIVVDNRPGGAGVIGTEIVARAVPDGYTLLLAPTGHSINPGLYSKLPYDPQRDFAAVSLLGISYAVVVVNPQSSIRNVSEAGSGSSTELNPGAPQHFLYLRPDPHQHGAFRSGGQGMSRPASMSESL